MRPYAPRPPTAAETTFEPLPLPAKRGRKPGPLSRSAREAQRRLNHSIIEKARRTKINDALATLKELVPAGYGQAKPPPPESQDDDDDDDDEDDDGEYTEGTKKAKPKPKATGKKEEKEKEFKLEILVRTVSFLQDLLKRVADMEANVATPSKCQHCSGVCPPENPTKRKFIVDDDDLEHDGAQEISGAAAPRCAKIPRVSKSTPSSSGNAKTSQLAPVAPSSGPIPPTPRSPPTPAAPDAARLPSISSWLLDSVIDPQLLPPANKPSLSPRMGSYLPSPPSSTHVDPVRTSHVPPMLNLGPVATAALVNTSSSSSNSSRTPEDESAASLLLQISAGSSPTFRPVPSSSPASAYGLPDPSNFLLHSDVRSQREGGRVRQAQTPGSMLGLNANVIGSRKYIS